MSEFESKRENRVKLYGVFIGVFSALFQHVFYVFGNAAAQLDWNLPHRQVAVNFLVEA